MNKKAIVTKTIEILRIQYPNAVCELDYQTPIQLLVAVILSAQCTDKRVNQVTKKLFFKYNSIEKFSECDIKNLEKDIHSTGFFRLKAQRIQKACQTIIHKFSGQIPNNMENMLCLSGVGRKTANVILGNIYSIASGIVVDTHMKRIATRLSLTSQKQADQIEKDLMRIVDKKYWIWFSHAMVLYGRYVCTARKPQCTKCMMCSFCPYFTRIQNNISKS